MGYLNKIYNELKISSAPTDADDAARKNETDALDSAKSDKSHRHDGQALGGTTPLTSVTTDSLDSTSTNTQDLSVSNVGAAVYASTNQTLSDRTFTKVQYDTENFDHRSEFDTANHQFVPSQDGIYQISAAVRFDTQTSGYRTICRINVNGTTVVENVATASNNNSTNNPQNTLALSSGDTVEISGFQQSGGSIDIKGDRKNTHLEAVKLG